MFDGFNVWIEPTFESLLTASEVCFEEDSIPLCFDLVSDILGRGNQCVYIKIENGILIGPEMQLNK